MQLRRLAPLVRNPGCTAEAGSPPPPARQAAPVVENCPRPPKSRSITSNPNPYPSPGPTRSVEFLR